MGGKRRKQNEENESEETEEKEVSESMQRLFHLIDSFRYKSNKKAPPSAPPRPKPTPKRKRSPPKPRPRSTLTAAERTWDAYRKLPPGFVFRPPPSSHRLLQEDHASDPWRVLVICLLLNITTGAQVKHVIHDFFALCPDAPTALNVSPSRIKRVISTLGLSNTRTNLILRLSSAYHKDEWTFVPQLPGVGKYAADAYAIFCSGWGAHVRPLDHKLLDYWKEIYGAPLPRRSRYFSHSTPICSTIIN